MELRSERANNTIHERVDYLAWLHVLVNSRYLGIVLQGGGGCIHTRSHQISRATQPATRTGATAKTAGKQVKGVDSHKGREGGPSAIQEFDPLSRLASRRDSSYPLPASLPNSCLPPLLPPARCFWLILYTWRIERSCCKLLGF